MAINVLWAFGLRGYWDHNIFMESIADRLWPTPNPYEYREFMDVKDIPEGEGAVVIVSGGQSRNDVEEVKSWINKMPWCLLLVFSDEEGALPWVVLKGDKVKIWTEYHDMTGLADRLVLIGYPQGTREAIPVADNIQPRTFLWSFRGQMQNKIRSECVNYLKEIKSQGRISVTGGFSQGLPQKEYISSLLQSNIACSPVGNMSADCFRTQEALECGCLPIVDKKAVFQPDGIDHWQAIKGQYPPFPVVNNWSEVSELISKFDSDRTLLQHETNKAVSWWMQYKRNYVINLENDIRTLSGIGGRKHNGLRNKITVLMPTSVIPSHPSTEIIEESIRKVRSYPELKECEILIMVDGVRDEQIERSPDYVEYTRRLLWKCNHDPEFFGCLPIVFDKFQHQANMARSVLSDVNTPYVLYVEHDTYPLGEIPFNLIVHGLDCSDFNCIRLHIYTEVHPSHIRIYDNKKTILQLEGDVLPLIKTSQWSQRPHIAKTEFYRKLIKDYFPETSRTMIEDRIHDNVIHNPEEFKVAIYAPEENMLRSGTSNGRKDDIKYEMIF